MEGTKITLKAPGSYKLDELKEICNTLGIDMKTKISKLSDSERKDIIEKLERIRERLNRKIKLSPKKRYLNESSEITNKNKYI